MRQGQWPSIRHFGPHENWGSPERISFRLVTKLDDFRQELGSPVVILWGTNGKHSQNSTHYKGTAADIICPGANLTLLDQYMLAEKLGFTGIGIYPQWHYHGQKCGGLHVDVRTINYLRRGVHGPIGARWIGWDEPDPENPTKLRRTYLELTHENLTRTMAV